MTERVFGLPGTSGRRRLYLMRHGEVSYFSPDGRAVDPDLVELTEAGRAQAMAMAALLAEIEFDRAAWTGLLRTRQTAELVLAGREGPELETLPQFREIRPGVLRGLARDRLEAEYAYGLERAHQADARFAGGDLYAEFEARITGAMEALLLEPGWTRMLLVAHDAVNRMALAWTARAGLAGLAAFEQDPGCLNIIDADVADGRIVRKLIKALNVTPTSYVKAGNYLTSLEQVFFGRPRKP
jgi:probable phosphoglycerate mutase